MENALKELKENLSSKISILDKKTNDPTGLYTSGRIKGMMEGFEYSHEKIDEIIKNYPQWVYSVQKIGVFIIGWLFGILMMLCINIKAQTPIQVWNDMGDFNKHRIACTSIAWTANILGCKATGDNQIKGAFIGAIAGFGIGGGKELIYDKWMHRGDPSWRDFGADACGTAVGIVAGIMCNGLAQHIRDKRDDRVNEIRLKYQDMAPPFHQLIDPEKMDVIQITNLNN